MTPGAKFHANRSMGLLGKWVNIRPKFLFIYTFFSETDLQVRPLGGF